MHEDYKIDRDAETGAITETWLKGGKEHREGGPATIWRDEGTGAIIHEEWWTHGKRISAPENLVNPHVSPVFGSCPFLGRDPLSPGARRTFSSPERLWMKEETRLPVLELAPAEPQRVSAGSAHTSPRDRRLKPGPQLTG